MSESSSAREAGYFHYRGRRSAEKKAARFFTLITQVVLILTLAVVMLFWGGRHPTAVGALGFGVMTALVTWSLSLALRGRWIWRHTGGLWLFVVALLLGILQLSPDFSAATMTQALRGLYLDVTNTGVFHGEALLAVIPGLQKDGLLLLVGAGLWYALARQVFDTDRRTLTYLALGLSAVACLAGVLGILQRFADLEWIGAVWLEPSREVAATWFNKNHFAQFEAMGLMLSLGLLTSFGRAAKGSAVQRLWSPGLRRGFFFFCATSALVCALGVLFSISRTATFLAGAALLLYCLYLLRYRLKTGFAPAAFGIVLIGGFVLIGGDYALSRLEYGLSGEDASGLVRFQIWTTTLSVIGLAPFTGTGFAAVRGLSSHFDTSYMPGYVTFDAHNDYLDLAAMFGIPFATVAVGWILVHFVRAGWVLLQTKDTRSSLHAVAIGAWLALFCALGHETMDYGLKQGANLLMALGLTVVLTGLLRTMGDASRDTVESGRRSTVSEREGLRVGRPFYAFPVLMTLCAGIGWSCYAQTYRVGEAVADFDNLRRVPSIRAVFSNEKWLQTLIARARDIETLEGGLPDVWGTQGRSEVRLAQAQSTDVMATAMSRVLDRSVSTRQVWREPYRRYREQAFFDVRPEERERVADSYDRASEAFAGALRADPLNGLTLSRLAKARDDAAAWRREWASSLPLHQAALVMYPTHAEVMRNAIDGYWQAWQETADPLLKREYENAMTAIARAFGRQVPYRLREIYPLMWSVTPDVALLEDLTPDDIAALEELGHFLMQQECDRAALRAFERVLRVNDARNETETVETIGQLEFLRREKRSKTVIARMAWERMAELYGRLQEPLEREKAERTAATLLMIEREPAIERIDRALTASQYAMAEAEILPIRDDVRAKIRMTEILLVTGRYEGLRHWVADVKAISENNKLPPEDEHRFQSVLEKMRRLGVPVPQAHEFDLPEDNPEELSQ